MNIKTTLVLLALLIGIGVYFLVFERGRDVIEKPGPELGAEKPVFIPEELFPEGVKSIQVHWADGEQVTLLRDEQGNWHQTEPVAFPLNSTRLQAGLVMDAAMLTFTDRFTPDQPGKPTLVETSLDKPRASIRFIGEYRDVQIDRTTGDPKVTTKPFEQLIHLGGGIAGSRAYIRLNEDPQVYVASNKLHMILLNERVAAWRQRSLNVPTDGQTQRIVIRNQDQLLDMNKPDGIWMFAPPLHGRVAPRAPMSILTALQKTPLGRFVIDKPDSMATYGLEPAAFEISVHTTAITPRLRTLRIGGPADPAGNSYYATWSQGEEPSRVVFTLTRDSRARFMAIVADDVRDPRITTQTSGAIADIRITTPGQPPVHLQKSAGPGWQFTADPGAPAITFRPDQEAVTQLIDALTRATAKYYRPGTGRPDQPLATIQTASRITGEPPEELVFFTPPAESIPSGDDTKFTMVLRNSETTGYLVPTASLAPVLAPATTLRDRQIVEVKASEIRQITIKRADGMAYVFRQFVSAVAPDAPPQWMMVQSEEFERDMFMFFLNRLINLRAETWIADAKPFGPNTVEVTIDLAGRKLVFECDLDTRQARVPGHDSVFMLDAQTRLLLDAEYRPRTILPLTPGEITQVAVTPQGAKTVIIGKDDLQRYHVLSPDGKPITTEQVGSGVAAGLFDSLMPLRAWRLVEKPDLKISDALWTLEVTTRTGQKHTVYVGFKDRPTLAMCNDRWFTLDADTLAKLTAKATGN